MKILIMMLVLALAGLAVEPAKPAAPVKPVPKAPPVAVTPFDQQVGQLKAQLTVIDKQQQDQRQALTKIERDVAQAEAKADSVYRQAKQVLQDTYNKELEKLVTQEQALKVLKDKLEASYKLALAVVDSAKAVKK